jgi:hypothetical protein
MNSGCMSYYIEAYVVIRSTRLGSVPCWFAVCRPRALTDLEGEAQ